MRVTRQLHQNLFLHFAEQPRLWLKLNYSSQLRFAHSRAGLDGRSSAAFRWVWHFFKDESVCPWSVVDLKDSGDELMPTKCSHSSHPSNLQDRTSARLLTSPFHGGVESRGQIQELRVLMSPQMPHRKTLCPSMQPPASERCSAMCNAQSLGSSLIHSIPAAAARFGRHCSLIHKIQAPQQGSAVCRGHSHSHDTSPSSAAAGFGRHCPLSHTIPAPQQQSAVCRGHSHSHDTSPTISGYRG